MTLILALGNPDQVIQISDRLLTDGTGTPRILPENKATVVRLQDASLLCGFAGLARTGRFRTAQWLVEAVQGAAEPDDLAHGTVERLTEAASEVFRSNSDLRRTSREHRGLSVMFTGYRWAFDPPKLIAAIVTKFQNFESGRDELPWNAFLATYWSVKDDPVDEPVPTYIQRLGRWPAMLSIDEAALREPLAEQAPTKLITDKGVAVSRIAKRPAAGGTIGTELSSVILYPDPVRPAEVGFHVTKPKHRWHGVNEVVSLGPGQRFAVMDPTFGPDDPATTPPVAVPKVGRNQPCPCGSGQKYKLCHGR